MAKKKSFKDLSFEDNQAVIKFKNGYHAIIRTGPNTATTIGAPYEYTIYPQNQHISDDIIGYLTEEEVTQLMYETQNLQKIRRYKLQSVPHFDW